MRRRLPFLLAILALAMPPLLYLSGRVQAAEGMQGDECIVAADEVIETDFFVACNVLVIEGTIHGDLLGAAWSASIRPDARITGDVWLLGGQLSVEGTVEDDLHFAGIDLDVAPDAQLRGTPDVIAAALNVEVWEDAQLPGDLIMFGYQAVVRGDVARDVSFNGSALVIAGVVQGDVYAVVGSGENNPTILPVPLPFSVSLQTPGLTVLPSGRIDGDLAYSGEQPGSISGRIGGEIEFDRILPRPDITVNGSESPGEIVGRYIGDVIRDVFALMAAGVLVLLVTPNLLNRPAAIIPQRLPASLGWGLVLTPLVAASALLLPLVSALLLLFVAFITLGGFTAMALVLLLMLNVVVIGGLIFVVFFMARLVFSMVIGHLLGRWLLDGVEPWAVNFLSLLLGVVAYALIVNIPVPQIAQVVYWVSIFIGLGAVLIVLRAYWRQTSEPDDSEMLYQPVMQTQPTPRTVRGRGTDNLPPGFDWWEE